MDINNLSYKGPATKPVSGDSFVTITPKPTDNGTKLAVTEPAKSVQSIAEPNSQERQQLDDAVSQINDYVQNIQRSLQFSVDEKSGRDVVTVVDKETDEVIRQIPTEEVLVIARSLADQQDQSLSLFSSQA